MTDSNEEREGNMTSWPSVGIVVLNWENYEDTAECLRSLKAVEYPSYEVIVVDNGSKDGSRERLVDEFKWCAFVLNEENRGFAAGNNPGIACAIERGAEYVLLLNNDTVVESDFLTPLVETAERNTDVAVVGGVEYLPGTDTVLTAGARFFPYLGGRIRPNRTVQSDLPYEVSYIPSSLVLLERDFVLENEVLHEGYFLGMDDVDLAVQARNRGKRVVLDPRSKIQHKEGLTSDRQPFNNYHWMRNRLEFASVRLSHPQRIVFYVTYAVTVLYFVLVWALRRRFDLIGSTYVGIRDHLEGSGFRSYESFQ